MLRSWSRSHHRKEYFVSRILTISRLLLCALVLPAIGAAQTSPVTGAQDIGILLQQHKMKDGSGNYITSRSFNGGLRYQTDIPLPGGDLAWINVACPVS